MNYTLGIDTTVHNEVVQAPTFAPLVMEQPKTLTVTNETVTAPVMHPIVMQPDTDGKNTLDMTPYYNKAWYNYWNYLHDSLSIPKEFHDRVQSFKDTGYNENEFKIFLYNWMRDNGWIDKKGVMIKAFAMTVNEAPPVQAPVFEPIVYNAQPSQAMAQFQTFTDLPGKDQVVVEIPEDPSVHTTESQPIHVDVSSPVTVYESSAQTTPPVQAQAKEVEKDKFPWWWILVAGGAYYLSQKG